MTTKTANLGLLFATAIASAAAFWLLREHWGHLLGYAPYLLFLACPLMHLFHGHGRHGHGHPPSRSEPPA